MKTATHQPAPETKAETGSALEVAEAFDELSKGDRADVGGTRQPQPVEALAVVERPRRHSRGWPILGSSPRWRRPMFSRCAQ